jgi:hypothetical protein
MHQPYFITLFYFFYIFMCFTCIGTPPYFLFNFRVTRLTVGDGKNFQKFVGGAYY